MKTLAEWSKAVKERDGKCVECGKCEDLHAHHVKPKSTHPELKLDVSNGKTLCYRCHKAEHERNRPVRIRTSRPQRKTLEARIEYLESVIRELASQNRKLSSKVAICERGSCSSVLTLLRKINLG